MWILGQIQSIAIPKLISSTYKNQNDNRSDSGISVIFSKP